jgi:hypothetical protein
MPYINESNSRLSYLGNNATCHCRQRRGQLSGFGQDPVTFPPDPISEDKFIDEELKRGTSVKDITNEIFWGRHPQIRGWRLPTCAGLNQLYDEWKRIQKKVEVKNMDIFKVLSNQ